MKVFSDEMFPVDRFLNRRSSRWIPIDSNDIPGINVTKQLQQMMVLGIIMSNGKKMPPIFSENGEIYTAMKYPNLPRHQILPNNYQEGNYRDPLYVWQQDGAPAPPAHQRV